MDTNKMRELKALAEAATQSHGARRVEVDHNGVHVIGDGSWKILSAWHTPDGKGAQNAEFAAAASQIRFWLCSRRSIGWCARTTTRPRASGSIKT